MLCFCINLVLMLMLTYEPGFSLNCQKVKEWLVYSQCNRLLNCNNENNNN